MKIEEFIANPIKAFIKAERYLNDGSPSGFSDKNTTSFQTCPRSATRNFNLKQLKFEGKIQEIGDFDNIRISRDTMFIHPDVLTHKLLSGVNYIEFNDIIVAPTASGRTVLSIEGDPFFIKLAYPKCLGRLIRHMGSDKINSAIETTKHLIRAVESGKTNKSFAFLREDYGRIAYLPLPYNEINSDDNIPNSNIKNGLYEWGVIFREYTPFPYIDKREHLIPFFALFGQEYDPSTQSILVNQDKPLVIQLFEKQKNIDFEEYLLEKILYPLLDTYFDALLLAGIELEAHAQNMLISIDNDYQICRIICRDLESAGRDATLMDFLGIPYDKITEYKYNYLSNKDEDQKYPKWQITHSFMFDFKLGEYIISPLLEKCKEYIPYLDIENICNHIKVYNKKYIDKLPNNFFPSDWCTYANRNFEQEGSKREYIWHSNPKYR